MYVDNYESLPNTKYITAFSHRYVCVHEPYMPRWFQISEEELVADIPSQKSTCVKSLGCSIPEEKKIEFHVDSFVLDPCLKKYISEAESKPGGVGSFQSHFCSDNNRKICISFGQDECIFKQYLIYRKACIINIKFRISPKDDGEGIMVSAF